MSYDGSYREGKCPSFHSWYYCARCLCNTGIAMVACCPAEAVPPIAFTVLAVHGCPMAGYTLCSSVLTEVACDKVVFQEICLTNEVDRYREVTLLGKVPIFGKVVSAAAMVGLVG